MKDFLNNFFIEPFKDKEYFLGVLCWLLGLLIIGVFLWTVLYYIDSSNLPQKSGKGEIINKGYTPEHFQTTYIHSGNTLIPVTNFVPAHYQIVLKINDLTDRVNITESYYDSLEVGDTIDCKYVSGRLFDSMYVEEISAKK